MSQKMKQYRFKYENLGERMRLSAISEADGSVIASATYVSSGPSNHAEFCAAHKHVHETAYKWAGGDAGYTWKYQVVRPLIFKPGKFS